MATTDPPLQFFEQIWKNLTSLYHKELVLDQPADFRNRYMRSIMPTWMTLGREAYNCRAVYHPNMTCRRYAIDKLSRAFVNAAKICFFASLIPQIMRKKKQLFKSDLKTKLSALRLIIWRYFQATMFIVLGTSLPFIIVCRIPLGSDPFSFLPFGWRISIVYSLIPILSLIVDTPSKMPSYMGFFVSKSIS